MMKMHMIQVQFGGEEFPMYIGCEDQAVMMTMSLQDNGIAAMYNGEHEFEERTEQQENMMVKMLSFLASGDGSQETLH